MKIHGGTTRKPGRASIVLTTCPNRASVNRLVARLFRLRLAACIQVIPMRSHYRWKGALVHDRESLLLIKTPASRYARVEAAIRSVHPYTVPEILRVPVTAGFPGYLAWLDEACAR